MVSHTLLTNYLVDTSTESTQVTLATQPTLQQILSMQCVESYLHLKTVIAFQTVQASLVLFNNSSDWLSFYGGDNVTINDYETIYENCVTEIVFTVTDQAALGGTDAVKATVCAGSSTPCFLPDALVALADGKTKAIKDVVVGDKVIGAFGEVNEVLALHRPLLGDSRMFSINDEHVSSDHHPHISVDKKFYTYTPSTLAATYGHAHPVVNGEGNVEMRHLQGLREGRVQKMEVGVELKTIEGGRIVNSLREFEMDPKTQLYNLVVSGSHTYHVNGYAVTGWPSEDDFDYDAWVQK